MNWIESYDIQQPTGLIAMALFWTTISFASGVGYGASPTTNGLALASLYHAAELEGIVMLLFRYEET
jgi:hypothetical protein